MISALHTDLYQITQLAAYFAKGQHETPAVFELFVRKLPENRRFMIFAGLQKALNYLQDLQFKASDIRYLRKIPQLANAFTQEFEAYLKSIRGFKGNVFAMREGTVFYPNEPVMRLEGPLGLVQFVETALLSIINHASMIATCAAHIKQVAPYKELLEFGTRRTSPEEAVETARAAYIGGFNATSNLEAGAQYDIPVAGTMAHSYIMSHESEYQAFEDFTDVHGPATLLIDTYEPMAGLSNAMEQGPAFLKAVRIDSGDFLQLSKDIRDRLDCAGFYETKIVVSGDLNEVKVAALEDAAAPIDVYAVGTCLSRSTDAPSFGGVYKLVEIDGRPVAKKQTGKTSLPGRHNVWRGETHDTIALTNELAKVSEEQLLTLVQKDADQLDAFSVEEIRTYSMDQVQSFGANREEGSAPEVQFSEGLKKLMKDMGL